MCNLSSGDDLTKTVDAAAGLVKFVHVEGDGGVS